MTETNEVGRPRVLTQEQMRDICERVADGETIRQIAKAEGMPAASTIYRTLGLDKSFSDQYAKAKAAQMVRWEDELIEIADDGSNDWLARESEAGRVSLVADSEHLNRSRLRVDTRKWVMSKREPKVYGDKTMHTGGDGEGPVLISATPITLDEWAKKYGADDSGA